jgi:hypothetical protein
LTPCNLSLKQFAESITADCLNQYVNDTLSSFGIAFGANVKCYAETVGRHVPCVAHLLQLCIRRAFDEVELASSLRVKAKGIVHVFKSTSANNRAVISMGVMRNVKCLCVVARNVNCSV